MKKKNNERSFSILFGVTLILGAWISIVMITNDFVYAEDYSSIIPESYHDDVSCACNGVSVNNLDQVTIESIERLSLQIDDSESLEFLNLFDNLRTLELTFSITDDRYCLDTVPFIPSLKSLTIIASEDMEMSFAANNGILLNNEDNLENLHLSGVNVGPDSVENLNNLKSLTLDTSLNNEIDYASLNLERLDLSWYGPYDVPIFLSYEDYNSLKANNVDVCFHPDNRVENYTAIWQEISQMAEKIPQGDSEQEMLDNLTAYVIDALEYDEEMIEKLDNGIYDKEYIYSFYKAGNLYGALEKDSSICGNYAALIKALAEYYDIESFYVMNDDHAWNLVLADGSLGYVDATSLDLSDEDAAETIRNGNGCELCWYMEETDDETAMGLDGREPPIMFPEYMNKLCVGEEISEPPVDTDIEESITTYEEPEMINTDLSILSIIIIIGAIIAMFSIIIQMRKTVTLHTNQKPVRAVLYWKRLKKKAVLGQSECIIGSRKGAVNLCIDNRIISRIHARIRWSDHGYYIKDMRSTNGTFINGRPVSSHEVLLHNGDIIRLGNEYFQFRYE